jgi:hypothetical protein
MSLCVCSVLFCVQAAALRWADPPSKKSYRLCIGSRIWKSNQGPTKGLSYYHQMQAVLCSDLLEFLDAMLYNFLLISGINAMFLLAHKYVLKTRTIDTIIGTQVTIMSATLISLIANYKYWSQYYIYFVCMLVTPEGRGGGCWWATYHEKLA